MSNLDLSNSSSLILALFLFLLFPLYFFAAFCEIVLLVSTNGRDAGKHLIVGRGRVWKGQDPNHTWPKCILLGTRAERRQYMSPHIIWNNNIMWGHWRAKFFHSRFHWSYHFWFLFRITWQPKDVTKLHNRAEYRQLIFKHVLLLYARKGKTNIVHYCCHL